MTATDHPAVTAIGIFVAYMVLVGVIWQVTGTRYDALVDSRAHVLRGIVLPIGLGALLLAIVGLVIILRKGVRPEAFVPQPA